MLNLRRDYGERGMTAHQMTQRLRPTTPYSLKPLAKFLKFDHLGCSDVPSGGGGMKRDREGTDRRDFVNLSVHQLIKLRNAIFFGEAAIVDHDSGRITDYHIVIWDDWRSILFIGPGEYDDRCLDGALLIHEEDRADPAPIDPTHGVTLEQYCSEQFGIVHISRVHVLMVQANRLAETHQVV